ncbi:MAG: transcription antitermination factor NusB [Verrucomicrobia bacterium]|jgi:N utilization substance protein B|nr:transcription antitermination factor NusB [Verrucomicrobiota bacterium]
MGVRRDAREAAVQYLYQREMQGDQSDQALEEFYEMRGLSPSGKRFCNELLEGWMQHREEIDEVIAKNARNFEFNRLSAVDRNVLRIACHEILFRSDIPAPVAINEAIEIAKKYSTEDSGKFVNGVLDNIRKQKSAVA